MRSDAGASSATVAVGSDAGFSTKIAPAAMVQLGSATFGVIGTSSGMVNMAIKTAVPIR